MTDEIEIDLRKMILVLLKHWWQIIASVVSLAIIAFVITTFLPESFRATSLVAVTQPLYQLNFDPKIQTVNVQPSNDVYLDLAVSDDVLKQVYDQWSDRPASISNLEQFREKVVRAESGSDASIIKLNIDTENPDQSAQLANQWATVLIEKTNEVYFGQDQQLSFLEQQLAATQQDLDQAEKALIDFQAQNQIEILNNQLNSALQNQSEYLAIQRNLAYLAQNLQGLRSQLNSNISNNAAASGQINLLLLQVQYYNNQVNTTNGQVNTTGSQVYTTSINPFPIQLQVSDQAVFGSLTSQEQITILDNLSKDLEVRTNQVTDKLIALDPEILNLQTTVEGYRVQLDQLKRTRDIATDTYTTLSKKVDEVRISDQNPSNRLQLASSALPPFEPLSRNRLRNTILAGFIGAILAVILILSWEWWHGQAIPEEK